MSGLYYGAPPNELCASLKEYNLWEHVTSKERSMLSSRKITKQQKADVSWLPECVQVLAWGLGWVELDHRRPCDDELANHCALNIDPSDIISKATLRSYIEIDQECDLLYRLHSAVRHDNAAAHAQGFDSELIWERHRASNWFAGLDPDWDEVTTDT